MTRLLLLVLALPWLLQVLLALVLLLQERWPGLLLQTLLLQGDSWSCSSVLLLCPLWCLVPPAFPYKGHLGTYNNIWYSIIHFIGGCVE